MKFLILICTLPERANKLRRLTLELDRQKAKYNGLVDYKIHDAGPTMPTGTKRNQLIEQSMSDYFSFIDDDDTIAPYYVDEMMNAFSGNPDVVTFIGEMTTDGSNKRNFVIKLGERYEERSGVYYRYCNHLCAFKRSAVRSVKFRPIWVQEDYYYATEIRDRRLLKTEVHINKNMYLYDFQSKKVSNHHRSNIR